MNGKGAATSVTVAIENVSKAFSGVTVLNDVSLELRPGEGHALAGLNGAGKSTLVKILAGALSADSGTICLEGGSPVVFHSTSEAQKAGIFTIYQELSLVPTLSAAENVFLADLPRYRGGIVNWAAARRETKNQLHRLGFDIDVTKPVGSLPLAYQQAIEIAKVLHRSAKVVLLDEPTAILSRPDAERLFRILEQLKAEGVSFLYISHHLEEFYGLCERVTVLRDGRKTGTFELPATPLGTVVGEMVGSEDVGLVGRRPVGQKKRVNPVAGSVGSGQQDNDDDTRREGVDTGLHLVTQGEPRVVVEGLSDGSKIRDVSLELHRGEILGVFGLAGSGQSELAHCLFGSRRIERGVVRVDGRARKPCRPTKAVALGIGLVPEERKTQGLVLNMSVCENVSLASLRRLTRWGLLRRRAERASSLELHGRLGIVGSLDQSAASLSGGNQQKVVLAKWLMSGVDILLLAEPTRGIDVHAKAELWKYLHELAEQGSSVLVMSSEIDEASLCHRVLVLRGGRLIGEVRPGLSEAPHDEILAMCTGVSDQ